jgi:hypothetical protein
MVPGYHLLRWSDYIELLLPQSSVALQVLVMSTPLRNDPPIVTSHKGYSRVLLSAIIRCLLYFLYLAGNVLAVHSIVIFAGHVINGPGYHLPEIV